MSNIESRLAELGISLPQAAAPAANYVPTLITGNQLIISGQLPMQDGALKITGQLGNDLSIEEGVEAARLCAINILAQIKHTLDGFDHFERLLKLGGFVNAPASFTDHPRVINGASDLMVSVLGDAGRHTRFAVGAAGLPFNAAVEIDALVEIKA
ncbi:MAG: RidA family protein [bacterium]|nr:RidA family protein [bacterium]